MTIGNLTQMSSSSPAAVAADPESERLIAGQAGLVVHPTEPLNCETPPPALGGEVTPTAQFYRRNHFPLPLLDEAAWRLDVVGMVQQPLSLSLHEITQLPAETAVVTLECAGTAGCCSSRPLPGCSGTWEPWAPRSGPGRGSPMSSLVPV